MKTIFIVIIISAVFISGCTFLDTPENNTITSEVVAVPDDNFSVDHVFKENVIALSSEICDINKAEKTEYLQFMDEEKSVYAGSLILNRMATSNTMILDTSKIFSGIYELHIIEKYRNKLTIEWNALYPVTCLIDNDSSEKDLVATTKKMGDFTGKTIYLTLKAAGYEPIKAFSILTNDVVKISKLDQKIDRQIEKDMNEQFGDNGVLVYDLSKKGTKYFANNAVMPALKTLDEIFYYLSGKIFSELSPYAMKGEIIAKQEFETKIIPETMRFIKSVKFINGDEFQERK
ncbi:MAG: hypothetical protein KAT05_06310 [Spirochaetes bacterium]|nr:hypothetical protein [Spirochaetota bacterium]